LAHWPIGGDLPYCLQATGSPGSSPAPLQVTTPATFALALLSPLSSLLEAWSSLELGAYELGAWSRSHFICYLLNICCCQTSNAEEPAVNAVPFLGWWYARYKQQAESQTQTPPRAELIRDDWPTSRLPAHTPSPQQPQLPTYSTHVPLFTGLPSFTRCNSRHAGPLFSPSPAPPAVGPGAPCSFVGCGQCGRDCCCCRCAWWRMVRIAVAPRRRNSG
jgi:hypothetical protein